MSGSDLLNGQGRLSQCDIVRDSGLLNLIKHIKNLTVLLLHISMKITYIFVKFGC